jgi:hypothetical protein
MRIDRNPAPIIGDGEIAVVCHLDVDEARMAGQRLVHGVVDDFGKQVMQRLLVGAANIHGGTEPDMLQPLQDFDVVGRIILAIAGPAFPGFAARRCGAGGLCEQVGRRGLFLCGLGHAVPLRFSGCSTT